MIGPYAYIVRRNTTNEPLHAAGSYDAVYRWCCKQPMNGHGQLMWPEGYVPVMIETPEHQRNR